MTEATTTDAAPAVKPISFMITGKPETGGRVSLLLNGKWRSFLLASAQGEELVTLLREKPHNIERIGEIADVQTWVAKRSLGRVTVDECDRLRLDNKLIDYGLTGRIGAIIEQGVPFESLVNFIERLDRNPDPSVKDDLYRFMEKGNLPLDPEGYVLGFKKVADDYRSIHSGVEDIKVWRPDVEEPEIVRGRPTYPLGGRVEMNREDCDPNRNRTCSRGLHVCSYEYLKSFSGQRVLIIRVDPEHVTAIPADHNDQKLRCCKLEIMGEIDPNEAKEHFKAIVDVRYPAKKVEPEPEVVLEMVVNKEEGDFTGIVDEADAEDRKRLRFTATADEITPEWSQKGYEAGAENGKKDKSLGYEYDPSMGNSFPEELPAEDRPIFCKGYVDGYEVGFKTSEGDDGWTLERVLDLGAAMGKTNADCDQEYSNESGVQARDTLIEWLEETFPDYDGVIEDHELVRAFDRAYRTAYHEAYYADEEQT